MSEKVEWAKVVLHFTEDLVPDASNPVLEAICAVLSDEERAELHSFLEDEVERFEQEAAAASVAGEAADRAAELMQEHGVTRTGDLPAAELEEIETGLRLAEALGSSNVELREGEILLEAGPETVPSNYQVWSEEGEASGNYISECAAWVSYERVLEDEEVQRLVVKEALRQLRVWSERPAALWPHVSLVRERLGIVLAAVSVAVETAKTEDAERN